MLGWLAAGVLLVSAAWLYHSSRSLQPGDPRLDTGHSGIVMLAADWCGYCRTQRTAFERAGVDYRWLDVDTTEGAAAMRALGGRGVPVTVVGQDVVHGYQPARLQALLAPLGHAQVF